MPEISVIVPIYNVEKYLSKCIDSILSQSFTDFELVLVDDGSLDGCSEICDNYLNKDNRVVVIHKTNGGLSDARNAGIEWALNVSNSNWLAFIDSDDYIHNVFLKKLYDGCVQNNADICMCNFERVNEEYKSVEKPNTFPEGLVECRETLFKILYSNWRTAVAWNKLYKKSLFNTVKYDYGRIHEDEIIIHKLLAECSKIYYLNEELYYYLVRAGSIITSEKQTDNELLNFEINVERLRFCFNNGLPLDYKALDIVYYRQILSLKSKISLQQRKRYLKIKREYNKLFVSCFDNKLKRIMLLLYFQLNLKRKE